MPILLLPTNQPISIFRAAAMLFMVNLFLGSFPGFFLFAGLGIFPAHVLVGPVVGIIVTNLATAAVVRGLYRRAQRAQDDGAVPVGLGDFLDEILYTLLGIMAGFPVAIGALAITCGKWRADTLKRDDLIFAGFGLLFGFFAVRGLIELRAFWTGTRPKQTFVR